MFGIRFSLFAFCLSLVCIGLDLRKPEYLRAKANLDTFEMQFSVVFSDLSVTHHVSNSYDIGVAHTPSTPF